MSGAVTAFNKMNRKKAERETEKPSRKVRSLHIRPAKGGHVVSTEYEPDGDEQGYCAPEDQVFTDHQAMIDHVSGRLKGEQKK